MRLRNITKSCLATTLAMAALSTMKEARAQAFNPNNPTASGYTLVFNSQFSGPTLPKTQWSTGWAWSQGSGLNSAYPNDEGLPSNITFQNGAMNLAATKGPTPSGKAYGTAVITSYRKFSQTYGYWQASIEFPTNAHGIWPAFWLVPTNFSWPPEIDIMEWLGVLPNTDYIDSPLWGQGFSNKLHVHIVWIRCGLSYFRPVVDENVSHLVCGWRPRMQCDCNK